MTPAGRGRRSPSTFWTRADSWLDVGVGARRRGVASTQPQERLQRNVERFAIAWFVFSVAIDVTFRGVVLVGLVNLSTLLVCSVASVRRTAVFGVAAVAAAALCPLWDGYQPPSIEVVRVVNTFLIGVVAVVIAVVRERRERQMLRIMAAAEAAQRAVLPTLPPQVGTVGIAARYHSAADEAMVGGDVFDMFYDDHGRVIALVGDVAGHGLGSVQEGARLIRAFRQYAPTSQTLTQLAALMNAYITPFLAADMFVTAVLVDATSPDCLTVASCGHPAPLLLSGDRLTEVPIAYGPPLGLGAPTQTRSHPWRAGDRLLLHTDGLLESRNRVGEFLTADAVEPALRLATLHEVLDATIACVEAYVPRGRMRDDVCLMVLENRSDPTRSPGPPRTTEEA